MENGNGVSAPVGLPRIGEAAPAFEAVTTQGVLQLADFRGSWVILFSHPADFTPVCTTEFVGFAGIYPQLKQRGVELLGLSIDSVYSHIAWVRNIEEHFDIEIPFPVIADLDKRVATLYGMIMPGESRTETSRCVFFIDPEGVVRAIIFYPLTTGRSMPEILRVIDALQIADKHHVATPANWHPGDPVIVPPPRTQEAAEERVNETRYDVVDWYLARTTV